MTESFFTPIARIHSCFKEKFGIPRQPNLVKDAPATLVFEPEFARPEAVRELSGFSHIWILFVFHQSPPGWQPMVRPPRLGGNQKVGVFASRSPFRPNPIGMSPVRLKAVEQTAQGPVLHLRGADILDQTPVLDIKPYLPWSDIIQDATGGFAPQAPGSGPKVEFSSPALAQCRERGKKIPNLEALVIQILKNDPRPGYFKAHENKTDPPGEPGDPDRIFGMRLFDFDLKWTHRGERIFVIGLDPVK